VKNIFIFLIKIYQKIISPIFGRNKCRFYPSCSNYSIEAFNRFGLFRGLYLSLKRIIKCNPFNEGGIDKVPDKFKF
jgi:hypothetical protein